MRHPAPSRIRLCPSRANLAPSLAVIAVVVLSSCDRRGSGVLAADPEPEERTAQLTVWHERYEIFLEHRFIVAGQPTAFVTHVTDLRTREPRREGSVTYELARAGAAPVRHVEPAPARAGIYIPQLIFEAAGEWRVTLRIPADGADESIQLPPFSVYASADAARNALESEAPDGISFLKEQQWKLLTRIEIVRRRSLTERLRVPGVVRPRPGDRAVIVPPLPGRLLAPSERPFLTLGQRVEAGETICIVRPALSDFAVRLAESEAEVVRSALAVERAESILARTRKLVADEAKSARDLEEADFELRSSRARKEAAEAVRSAYRRAGAIFEFAGSARPDGAVYEIASPIAGVIVAVEATVGEHVETNRPIATILDTTTVHVEARIREWDVSRVGAAKSALYETPDRKGLFLPVLAAGTGRVAFLGLEVDPATRTVPLVYEVDNPEGVLRIGNALNVFVETAAVAEALAVPESAIVDEDGRPIAFVQVSGETFEKRDLVLGIRDGGFVEVVSGLSAGEHVVTEGGYAIRLASVSTSIPAHGHAH